MIAVVPSDFDVLPRLGGGYSSLKPSAYAEGFLLGLKAPIPLLIYELKKNKVLPRIAGVTQTPIPLLIYNFGIFLPRLGGG